MTFVAIGVAVPPLGFASQTYAVPASGPVGFETRKRFYSVDPLLLRTAQPAKIPVDLEHGHLLVGDVRHLEVSYNGSLWAVAEMNGPLPETAKPLYWSVRHNSRRDGSDVVIERIAVTERPAMLSAEPLRFLDGELREHNLGYHWTVPELERGILRRAAESRVRARRGRDLPILLADVDQARGAQREEREYAELALRGAPGGPLHIRGGGRILSVR